MLLCRLNVFTLGQRGDIEAAKKHGSAPQVSYVPKPLLYTFALGVELLGECFTATCLFRAIRSGRLRPFRHSTARSARDQLGWTPALVTGVVFCIRFRKSPKQALARAYRWCPAQLVVGPPSRRMAKSAQATVS